MHVLLLCDYMYNIIDLTKITCGSTLSSTASILIKLNDLITYRQCRLSVIRGFEYLDRLIYLKAPGY